MLAAARRVLQRARAGKATSQQLIEHFDALATAPWSSEIFDVQREIELALVAGDSPAGVARVVAREHPMRDKPRALLFRDGDPLTTAWPENPWHISPRDGLGATVRRLWARLGDARLVPGLERRVLGLALFESQLGYLIIHERDKYQMPDGLFDAPRPRFDRREGLAWAPFGDLSMLVGERPVEALAPNVPAALGPIYAANAGLSRMWSLAGPSNLLLWKDMLQVDGAQIVRAEDPDERRRADELLYFFSYGDDTSDLFDLTDGSVRSWGEGCLWKNRRTFDEWLDEVTPLILYAESPL
jgi:hypothetical protein